MDYLSSDHKHHLNQHNYSHKLCHKTGHPLLSLMESQWKLRQPDLSVRKTIVEQIPVSEKRKKSERAELRESQSGIQVGELTI